MKPLYSTIYVDSFTVLRMTKKDVIIYSLLSDKITKLYNKVTKRSVKLTK